MIRQCLLTTTMIAPAAAVVGCGSTPYNGHGITFGCDGSGAQARVVLGGRLSAGTVAEGWARVVEPLRAAKARMGGASRRCSACYTWNTSAPRVAFRAVARR